MAKAVAAARWRNLSQSTLRSNNADPLLLCNALYLRNFSATSKGPRDESREEENDAQTKASPTPSNFNDVRASLQNLRKPSPPRGRPPESEGLSSSTPSNFASREEMRKNLSEFSMRSPPPGSQRSDAGKSSSLSFQALYESNVGSNRDSSKGREKLSFESIRDSLRQLRSSNPENPRGNESLGSFSLKAFGESLRLRPGEPSQKTSDLLPSAVFGKEMQEQAAGNPRPSRTEFMKMYSYEELGQKLKKLRPECQQGEEQQEKKRFSLTELNERLQKLREIEEKESESNIGGVSFKDLRESLYQLRMSTQTSNKKASLQRLALLGQLGGQAVPTYMVSPPKDELVERYFHPDNMSAEEKLKIELNKIREEFKINKADCGSSRVQVAQLTTKIKYLAQVLHKKDKHSRKGLQEMIQRRKKLLKYLRRTDWDSYCFVISKLGLRDNPDYKT